MTLTVEDLRYMTSAQIAAWVSYDENETESNETENQSTQTEL